MEVTLRDIVSMLPLNFSKGDSEILKMLLLKDDHEFLRFKGKDQFDKIVRSSYPNIDIYDLYEDYRFATKKANAVWRLCKWFTDHEGYRLLLKFRYNESMNDDGIIIGTEYAVLDRIVRPVGDKFWNKYLPPNFAFDMCTVDFTFNFMDQVTDIPRKLPLSIFECNYNELFLSKLNVKEQSQCENSNWLLAWGIDIKELLMESFEGTDLEAMSIDERKKIIDEIVDKKAR